MNRYHELEMNNNLAFIKSVYVEFLNLVYVKMNKYNLTYIKLYKLTVNVL